MKIILTAVTRPITPDANIWLRGVSQIINANASAARKAIGMALVAFIRKPTIRTKISRIGIAANRARIPSLMSLFK
jgi:hypothetical protein